jgi:RHS repeat-associated protein
VYHNDAALSATRTLNFDFDAVDRVERVLDGTALMGKYVYAGPRGRVRKLSLLTPASTQVQVTKEMTYDNLQRPAETHYTVGLTATTLRKYTEGWGDNTTPAQPALNRRTFLKSGCSSTVTYGYDRIGRLESEQVGAGLPVLRGFDLANNRLVKGLTTYQGHNASNEVGSSVSPSVSFTHDARGNITLKDTAGVDENFDYDKLSRLVTYQQANPTGPQWTYSYDALGRRVKKSSANEARYYFYDGSRLVLEVVEPSGQSAWVREYVNGRELDEVMMEWLPDGAGQREFWPLRDSLGTVRDLADLDAGGTARVRVAYDYDADGNLTAETQTAGTITQDVLFTGRTLDREMVIGGQSYGIYYYRARQYDPSLGRFLQRDPIGVWGDANDKGNGYSYSLLNPVNATDPSGMTATFRRSFEDTLSTLSNLILGTVFASAYVKARVTCKSHDGCTCYETTPTDVKAGADTFFTASIKIVKDAATKKKNPKCCPICQMECHELTVEWKLTSYGYFPVIGTITLREDTGTTTIWECADGSKYDDLE